MSGEGRALARLLAIQGAWSYERMIGIGMGFASQPLLEGLGEASPDRHREATARSAEFFNSHPYLAGLALGAAARAELDGAPGAQIQRLRTALCSPLGALGDQVFWAGLVPFLMSLVLAGLALGAGGWLLLAAVASYNLVHLAVARWALRTGLDSGMQVGTAVSASWLPRAASRVAVPAGLTAGLALPLVAGWLLAPSGPGAPLVAGAAAGAALVLVRFAGARMPSLRVGLVFAVLTLLWTRFTS